MTYEDLHMEGVAINNDTELLEYVMDKYSNEMLRMAGVILKDFKLAEDITQEAFIKFYYSLNQFRGEADVKTYLYRILINECRQQMRKNWFKRVFTTGKLDQVQKNIRNPVDDRLERLSLSQSLMGIDIKYREVILLHYYNDLSIKEISSILGQPEGTVKSKLKRAREKLKRITKEAVTLD